MKEELGIPCQCPWPRTPRCLHNSCSPNVGALRGVPKLYVVTKPTACSMGPA